MCSYTDQAKSHRAVSEATAFLMSSMLADVINAGTAYRARQAGFTLPAAGKTGTTNDYVDAWFVGYTPHLVTGVWVGFDQPHDDHLERLRRRYRRAALGELHEGCDQGRQAGLVRPSVERRRRQRLPRVGEAPQRRLQQRRSGQSRRLHRIPLDDLHGVLRQRDAADGRVPAAPVAIPDGQARGAVRRAFGTAGSARAGRVPVPEHRGTTGASDPAPTAAASDEIHGGTATDEQPKKRGFWSKVFGKKDKGDDDKKKEDKKSDQ